MRLFPKTMTMLLCANLLYGCVQVCDSSTLKQSPEQILKACSSAAEKGEVQAEYNLGAAYMKLEQYDHAFHWMKQSADHGHVWGQYQLATLYDRGLGTLPDMEMAKKYYLLAAKGGDRDAMQNLGNIFLENATKSTSPSDYAQAKHWFLKGACSGQAKAQHNLSLMMAKGEGIPKDYNGAYYWAAKAQANGYKASNQTIATLKKLMSEKELVQAKDELQKPSPLCSEAARFSNP